MNQPYSEEKAQLTELQSHIQRQLGRCMLQLQQYEALLKRMLPYASYSGRPEELPALLAEAADFIGSKTMGGLVGILTETVLRPSDQVSENPNSSGVSDTESTSVNSHIQIVFDAESYKAIKTHLKELVTLRNMLVHEFLTRFDIRRLDGCIAAETFLSKSLESINAHLATLRGWMQTMTEAHTSLVSALGTPAFQSFLYDGIAPDGIIHWGLSGIVSGLRDAEANLTSNGWTPLDSAIAWMGRHAPEQTPKRYGCSSWRQVLHDSKQFDIFKQPSSRSTRAQQLAGMKVWYRSRKSPLNK
jgi:hypothetical protein